jgi:hypothetical protein
MGRGRPAHRRAPACEQRSQPGSGGVRQRVKAQAARALHAPPRHSGIAAVAAEPSLKSGRALVLAVSTEADDGAAGRDSTLRQSGPVAAKEPVRPSNFSYIAPVPPLDSQPKRLIASPGGRLQVRFP